MADQDKDQPAEHGSASPAEVSAGKPSFQEIEIKFRVDGKAVERILNSALLDGAKPGPARVLVSTYFDTAGNGLQQSGMTLRVRKKGRAIPVIGVKWSGETDEGLFARGEIEARCPGGLPDITLFENAIQDRLNAALAGRPLVPVFETRVRRQLVMLRHGRSEIEVAIDEGVVAAGKAERPLAEIELELKSGNLPDLLACARALALECRLTLELEPKSARGYRLAAAALPAPRKAKSLELPATASFDDLVTAVTANTLSHFVANWGSLRESDAPESIHQLRVALRRMRAALGMFRQAISLRELEDIRAEARRIASLLGPARECDAFRQNALSGPLRGRREALTGSVQLLAAVEDRRQDTYDAARRLIDHPSASLFVLDIQDFLARRAWRTALTPQDLGLLTSEARFFATDILSKLHRRALKRGKTLPDMPDAERHELRIALKKLRYAAEFFASLFGGRKEVRGFIARVADLQEDLGAYNDAATAESFIASLKLGQGGEASFAAGYLLGWYRHASMVADSHLARKWKAFRQADAFWE